MIWNRFPDATVAYEELPVSAAVVLNEVSWSVARTAGRIAQRIGYGPLGSKSRESGHGREMTVRNAMRLVAKLHSLGYIAYDITRRGYVRIK